MTIAATPSQYFACDGEALRDRDAVLALWSGNLGQKESIAAKYDWFYLGCPYGAPLLQLLHHAPSESQIGTASAGLRRMLCQGRELRAGVLVDLTVIPEHRSLGPALILQQGLIESAARNLDLIYGFPNPKAAAVFKRIGYEKFADIVRYARVLRHNAYLRKRMPAWLALLLGVAADLAIEMRDGTRRMLRTRVVSQWAKIADPRMDALWSISNKGHGLVSVRDHQHARWRFDASPLASTRYLLLTRPGTESLKAWFATQVDEETLHVRDFWSEEGIEGMDEACILALLSAARRAGHSSVSVEISGQETTLTGWRNCGFMERSRRPVFGRWSYPQGAESNPSLFLTSADEDE